MDIFELPKIELHCHLDGSLPISFIKEELGDEGIQKEQVQVQANCSSLAEYLQKFKLPLASLKTEKSFERAGYSVLAEVRKENVKYIELRFAPMLSVSETLSCRQAIEGLVAGLKRGEREFEIKANVIVCMMRHLSLEENLEAIRNAREMLGEGVCAVDLAGDEAAFANGEFKELFEQVRKWDMPFTIHAGECGSAFSVKEALELGAKRIGHGIALRKDWELVKEVAKKNIGIEMCPTSNLQTKAIDNWQEYPLIDFVKAGLKVSVNTDNRTVSNTTMTKELELVYQSSNQDEELIRQVLQNALETSFASEEVKHDIGKKMGRILK